MLAQGDGNDGGGGGRPVLTVTLRDLQWRARRFGLGVAATALVFAMTLLLAGTVGSFQNEIDRTISIFQADRWVLPAGASGPFTSTSPVSEQARAALAATPGAQKVEAVIVFRHDARGPGGSEQVNVIAAEPGGMVRPPLVAGRAVRGPGEAVVDARTGFGVGDRLTVGDLRLTVVGRTEGLHYFAGTPVLLLSTADGRRLAYAGAPLASAFITRGTPAAAPPGLQLLDTEQVRTDLGRPMRGAVTTLIVLGVILSVIAAGIVALMTYLSGLDRIVDFAVFKAIGVRTGKLLTGLVLQALLLAVGAAALASGLAYALAPALPIGVRLTPLILAALFGLAIVVGLLVSLVNVRQATAVDPALAFGRNA